MESDEIQPASFSGASSTPPSATTSRMNRRVSSRTRRMELSPSDGNSANEHEAAEENAQVDGEADDFDISSFIVHSRVSSAVKNKAPISTAASMNKPISKRRTYNFINRVANPRKVSSMRKRWNKMLDKQMKILKTNLVVKVAHISHL